MAYLNMIATAVPDHEVHRKFVSYAPRFLEDDRQRKMFARMAARAQIEQRYSVMAPDAADDRLDADGLYTAGAQPATAARMALYKRHAFALARRALDQVDFTKAVTHLIVTSCTGFYAPGLDLEIIGHYGLSPSIERTFIGFMGCQAAINALKLASHIVRAVSGARVLIVNLELCTLHLQQQDDLQQLLTFLLFADGCAASIVSAEPHGLELTRFHSAVLPETADHITWHIGDNGFDMLLSPAVPPAIARGLMSPLTALLQGAAAQSIANWAVHPGGRGIIDAVQQAARLDDGKMAASRDILRRYGNMSSPSIMFVLKSILDAGAAGLGCALAFGPGVTVEGMMFEGVRA